MRHFGSHHGIKLPRLKHLLNVCAKLCESRVLILITNHRQHVVEHISNHLDLHTRLHIVVFHSNFRLKCLLLFNIDLLLANYLVKLANSIIYGAVVCLYLIKSLLHVLVEFIHAFEDLRIVRMWLLGAIGLLLRIATII